MGHPTTRHILALLLVAATSMLAGLGDATLWEQDEPRFAEATRQMFARGDFITPYLNAVPRFEKPILMYWLQAAAYVVFGATEFAARLPSALAGIAAVIFLYLITARTASASAALVAGLALATTFRVVTFARQGLTDIPVLFFIVAALYGFLRAAEQPESRAHAVLAWVCVALGVLMKGPVGVLALIIWGSYAAVRRDWTLIRSVRPISGVFIAAAVALPWYVAMFVMHGNAWLDFALGHEVVARVLSEESFAPERGLFYYWKVFPGDAAPWSLLFIAGCAWCARRWRQLDEAPRRAIVFALTWFVTVFVVFTLSQSKVPHYILPAYPAAALVIGVFLDGVGAQGADALYWRVPILLVAGVTLIAAAATGLLLQTLLPAESFIVQWLLPAVLVAGAAIIVYAVWRRALRHAVYALAATLALAFAVIALLIVPRGIEQFKPMPQLGRQVARLAPADATIGLVGRYGWSSLIYYGGHTVKWLEDDDAAIAFLTARLPAFGVMPLSDYERLRARVPLPPPVAVAEEFTVRIERLLDGQRSAGRMWVLVAITDPGPRGDPAQPSAPSPH